MNTFFTSTELREKLKGLVAEERKLLSEILEYLKLIEDKKLFLEWSFGSMFDYCTRELGYSEAAAQRRIQAMRLMKSLPEVKEKIESGELSLTVAAQAQTFFKQEDQRCREKKQNLLSIGRKQEIVKSLFNTSKKECERRLLEISPEAIPVEKVRPLAEDKTLIQFVADKEFMADLEKLKSLTSHSNPNGSYEMLFRHLAKMALQKLDPERKITSKNLMKKTKRVDLKVENVISTPPAAKRCTKQAFRMTDHESAVKLRDRHKLQTRYVPASIRQEIWMRDGGRCSHQNLLTNAKCNSNYQIQIDQIKPFALGGTSEVKNLRLLCAQHNRFRVDH